MKSLPDFVQLTEKNRLLEVEGGAARDPVSHS